jgi:hypothetical protein
MTLRGGALIAALLFGAICGVQGGVYHVASNGNNNNNGVSQNSAWLTIAKANDVVVAGDVVIVHVGQYADGIHPTNSGRAGSPITFQAAAGDRVVLNTSAGVQLGASHSHIIVDGFEVHASYRMAEIKGSSYITIRNCTFYGGRGDYGAFGLDNASYCVVQNNYMNRQDPDASSGGGDGLALTGQSNHNLIEGNTMTRCGHVAFTSSYHGQYQNIWRNNIAFENHTNYSLQDGVDRSVFENNTGYYQGLVWTGGSGNCLQFTGTNCIIRFNTLYDDTATAYIQRQWMSVVGAGTGSDYGSPSMQYNKIYNNTLYGENDQKEWQKEGWRSDNYNPAAAQNDNVFKNNIFADAPAEQVVDIDAVSELAARTNQYAGNLLRGPNGQPALIRYEFSGGGVAWTLNEAVRTKPAQWASSNKEGDPLFVNTAGQGPAKDFNLRSGSPAVDAGVNLTIASNGNSGGTNLVVGDAGYFIDGWGIPQVEGDSILIEGQSPVGIAHIDYGTNSITLNSPRAWAQGARIYYFRSDRFQGAAPDIGSHELRSSSSPPPPPPPPSRPSSPLLYQPQNGAADVVSTNTTLQWILPGSAQAYRVQVSRAASFGTLEIDVTTGDQSLSISTLSPSTSYYWRVEAINAAGTSDWSEVWVLTTAAAAPQGTPSNLLLNPGFEDNLNSWFSYSNGQANFSVSSPGSNSSHAARFNVASTGDNTQIFQSDIVLNPNTKYVISFAAYSNTGHDLDLSVGKHSTPYTNYGLLGARFDLDTRWKTFTTEFTTSNFTSQVNDARLRIWFAPYAAAGDVYYIDNIAIIPASALPAGPVLLSPPAGAAGQPIDITLKWQKRAEASSYDIEIALDGDFAARVVSDTGVVDTIYRLSSLDYSTTYYWHVRSRGMGGVGAFDSPQSFSTIAGVLATPVWVSRLDTPRPVSFTVGWARVPDANRYHLQLAADDKFRTIVLDDSTIADTLRDIGPLQYGTRYFLRVRAIGTTGKSAFSASLQFVTVQAAAPAPPAGVMLASEAQKTSATLVWPSVPGALLYHLQVSGDPLFAALVVSDSSVTDTVRTVTSLKQSSRYFARVRAKGMGGVGVFSPILAFVTAGSPTGSDLPRDYYLEQNFPNPFNPKTGIRYQVPALSGVEGSGVSDVKITVYDMLGREVAVLVNERKEAGQYQVTFDGSGLASGAYIYRLTAGSYAQTRHMVLVK